MLQLVRPGVRRTTWLIAAVALAGFALARLLDLVILLHAVRQHPGHSLGGYLSVWDGGWYRSITVNGYPAHLYQAPSGWFYKSALAFFPAYPELVRGIEDLTHLSFAAAGTGLDLVAAAAAAVVLAFVLRPRLGAAAAATASVFWSFLPVSPVLMLTYTEALFSLELVMFFWLLARRRYVWLALLLPVAGLTRGALPPLALVLLVHLAVRWREDPLEGDTSKSARLRATAQVGGLLVALAASFTLWPGYVGLRTGRLDAYVHVQQSWIRDQGTYRGWDQALRMLSDGDLRLSEHPLVAANGLVAAVGLVLLLLAVLALFAPLSAELKTLAPSYLLFFVLAEPAWSSFFRYVLPVFTLAAVPAMVVRACWWPVRVAGVAVVLAGFACGQLWWIDHFVVPFPDGFTP